MLEAGAVILAGGESKRIGKFKALIRLNGRPLVTYVVEKAVKLFDEVVVAGSRGKTRELKVVLPPNVRVIEDSVEGQGPLVGIVSGAEEVSREYMAVLPCDSPFIKPEVLNLLYKRCVDFDASIPRWPNGYIEPLHSVYRTNAALSAGLQALKAGRYRVEDMISRLDKVRYVDVEYFRRIDADLLTFFNINRVEDLWRAEKIILKSGVSETNKRGKRRS